ncbi:MAG: acetyl-CoA hydrolase/transferase C-terminal domain-containing protein, partial [Chloroflexota bacterium]|nr:acetyl-CoA hydrolase/transferase C-terminal domain-containing protein [Chloroflexota bacterium]
DNYVHVSQIDRFVEHPSSDKAPGSVDLSGKPLGELPRHVKPIAEHVSALIRNGDTLQLGTGGTSEALVRAGLLEGKEDIGWHSEVTPGGIVRLVKEGVVTGRYKTIDRGKAVAAALGGGTQEEMAFVHLNPLFELRDVEYTHHPRVIGSLDNMVAINNALAVDLTGQVAAESLGPQMYSGAGGLLAFAIGATLSREGKFITTLPATARGGTLSTIVPCLEEGSVVTVPRVLTDIVATEYGVAKLKGKTQRERAEALISIAHPDFRAELRREAQKLLWP